VTATNLWRIAEDLLSRRGVWLAASTLAIAVIAFLVVRKLPEASLFGSDSYAYWAVDPASPYGGTVGDEDAFLYAPPLAIVFGFLNDIPWPIFRIAWLMAQCAALVWIAREWTLVAIAIPPVFNELFFGNINLFYAVAIVLGFRFPAAWAFMLLTKVTPGIGLLWFVVRREWQALATVSIATGIIVLVSTLLTPGLWGDWLTVLATSDSMAPPTSYQVPLIPRMVAAAGLIVWGARTDRRWTVPIAVTLALPVIWSAGLSILVALLPLLREARAKRRDTPEFAP